MSEFVKIKPVRNLLTGTRFVAQSTSVDDAAIITCHSGDSLFTTELKEGDKVTFYNKYNKRNKVSETYTVDSITSITIFLNQLREDSLLNMLLRN
mgnify:CR=1 FL=1